MDLKSLYRDVILEHYKKPRNVKPLFMPSIETRCKNPSCGDKVTLQLHYDGDRVDEVAFIGNGCAISQASTSMMTEAIKGHTQDEIRSIVQEFRRMVVKGETELAEDVLGELITMQGVSKLHARIKCALCGWSALESALENRADQEVDLGADASLPTSSA
jgi:nitrogen fixation NifU-like protein